MPRTLPPGWDVPTKKEPVAEPSVLGLASDDGDEEEYGHIAKRIKAAEDDDDAVLISSPPSRKAQPKRIIEAFMIPGVENDDKYCMVEDELYEIAKKFTAHLHAEEYRRLQAETNVLSEEAIRNMSRPVTGAAATSQDTRHSRTDRLSSVRRAAAEDGNKYKESSLYALMNSSAVVEMPQVNLMPEGPTERRSPSLSQALPIPGALRPETSKSQLKGTLGPGRQSPFGSRSGSLTPVTPTERRATPQTNPQRHSTEGTMPHAESGEETGDATTGDEAETTDEDSEVDLDAIPRPAQHDLPRSRAAFSVSNEASSPNTSIIFPAYPRPEHNSSSQGPIPSSHPTEHTGDSDGDSDFSDDIFASMRRKRMAKTLHRKAPAPKATEAPKQTKDVMPTFL